MPGLAVRLRNLTKAVPRPLDPLVRLLIVASGILFGQAILYGPSLVGARVLLPLDLLAAPAVYLPTTPEAARAVPHDVVLSDLVLFYEPARQFAVSEIRVLADFRYGRRTSSLEFPAIDGASRRRISWVI